MKKLRVLCYMAFAGILLFSSCAKEDDELGADARDKFAGSWKCTETLKNSNPAVTTTFTISIVKTSGSSIGISNFDNLGASTQTIALISGSVMTINNQSVDKFAVSGTGNYANGRIEMNYQVDNEQYSATCIKN